MPKKNLERQTDRRQLQQVIADLSDGIMLIEPSGWIVWANKAALRMHGCAQPTDFGMNVKAYCKRFLLQDQEDRELAPADYPLSRLLGGETFLEVLLKLTRRDDPDSQSVLEFSGLVLTDANDEPDSLVLVMNDVTDEFEAEERFERAFAANPAPALILRLDDSRYLKANKGFLDMTGYAREEIVGRPMREFDALRNAQFRDEAIQALSDHATIRQQEALLQINGGEKFVIVAGQPIEVDGEACMLFTFDDLDERKKTETALRQSEARFEISFRMAPVPMLVCTPENWGITEANEAFYTMVGRAPEDVIGQPLSEVGLRVDDEFLGELTSALGEDQGVRDRDIRLCLEGGTAIDGLLSAEQVGTQKQPRVLFTIQDITERKRSEEELLAAIEAVTQNASWFSQALMEKLAQVRHRDHSANGVETLTAREREVLGRICDDMSDDEIAASLHLSTNTVRNYVAILYNKIGVNRRSSAVVWGRRRGLGG
jgi:PAS domain S-box-containing protein